MKIRARATFRNETMIAARKALGLSQIKLHKAIKCPLELIIALEKFKYDIYKGTTAAHGSNIAKFLDIPVNDVLPPELIGEDMNMDVTTIRIVEADRILEYKRNQESRMLIGTVEAMEEMLEKKEMKKMISGALNTLTLREKEILEMRFGLFDRSGEAISLAECGKRFKVTRECVRQIENKALRKLQHPVRKSKLESLID